MVDVEGYLGRLGLAHPGPHDGPHSGAPSVEGLHALHRAHVERIVYNSLDLQLGRPGRLQPARLAHRVVAVGRAGYCLHCNGAFSALLKALGYDVRWHVGGVQRRVDPEPVGANANHLALTVHGLPAPDCPDGVWYADVGLGDGLHEPLPLRAGEYTQGPFRYRLELSTVVPGGWRFTHDPAGSFTGMDFDAAPARPVAFALTHRFMSTDPQSPFLRVLSVVRRDAGGFDLLRGLTLTRVDGAGRRDRELASGAELFQALEDVFGLPLSDVDSSERERLWHRAHKGHLAWIASEAGQRGGEPND